LKKIIFTLSIFMTGEMLSVPLAPLLALPFIPLMKPLTARRPAERVLAVLFIPAAAVTAFFVCRRLASFIGGKSLPLTPVWLIAAIIGALAVFCAMGGSRGVERWSEFVFPLVAGFIVLSLILLVSKFYSGGLTVPPVSVGNPLLLACEAITLTGLIPALGYKDKPFRAYLAAFATALGIGAVVWSISNFTLGPGLAGNSEFPFYTALRIAKGGEILGRVEGFLIPVLLCAAVLKAAACVFVIFRGIGAYRKRADSKL
jgi:hypothetical protein